MKILSVIISIINCIKKLFVSLLRGGGKVNITKKDQIIKHTNNSESIQVKGNEINAKGDVIKTGNGSPLRKGDSTTIYNKCIFFVRPEDLPAAKEDSKQLLKYDIPQKYPSIDKAAIERSTQLVEWSGSAATLSSAIPTISGMLAESSHGETSFVTILREFYEKLSGYIEDDSNTWTCPGCKNVNVNILDSCPKCKKEKPKGKIG
jgi:hypothetical protein